MNEAAQKKLQIGTILNALRGACNKIAPSWPLENFVAVNPYMGLAEISFKDASKELALAAGIRMSLPISFYLEKIKEKKLSLNDIDTVLKKTQNEAIDVNDFVKNLYDLQNENDQPEMCKTVADIASNLTRYDWNSFITSRISSWAASYFDNGQAIWQVANKGEGIFASWKKEASKDLHPEIMGLIGFRNIVKVLPENPMEAVQLALDKLGICEEQIPLYFHRLLRRVGGWASYIARIDFDNRLYHDQEGKLLEFLSLLICWELCLFETIKNPQMAIQWEKIYSVPVSTGPEKLKILDVKLVLQEAFDLGMQRKLIEKFLIKKIQNSNIGSPPKVQAVFCIDVRSEVYRRKLEQVDDTVETIGFAGFFAFPIKYVPLGQEEGQDQCPVLLKPGAIILEEIPDKEVHLKAVDKRIFNHQVNQLLKSFKSGAISCFSFVSPIGLFYLPKLFTDSFGLTRPVPHPEMAGLREKFAMKKHISLAVESFGNEVSGITIKEQVQLAKNALKAMSLTDNFATFILIVGHGSTSVNNPHATGLDCGACGGHTGEANAKVASEVLNSVFVREHLKKEGIHIPSNTIFLACLHNTTTDEISIYNEKDIHIELLDDWAKIKKSLIQAGKASRLERSLRLNGITRSNVDFSIINRSKDWSQVRPEWGLAGCSTFVVASRTRTKGIDFGGKSFLHSYEWEKDTDFAVLELIMTAPMVVTSWINLQYFASTTDNKTFGSGNKTLHNITAGLGVLEGGSGDLKIGLPWQSLHDGNKYQHEPLRLNVIIEAPMEAINEVLKKHSNIRNLCDNEWIYLLLMDHHGKVSHRYTKNFIWEKINLLEVS